MMQMKDGAVCRQSGWDECGPNRERRGRMRRSRVHSNRVRAAHRMTSKISASVEPRQRIVMLYVTSEELLKSAEALLRVGPAQRSMNRPTTLPWECPASTLVRETRARRTARPQGEGTLGDAWVFGLPLLLSSRSRWTVSRVGRSLTGDRRQTTGTDINTHTVTDMYLGLTHTQYRMGIYAVSMMGALARVSRCVRNWYP